MTPTTETETASSPALSGRARNALLVAACVAIFVATQAAVAWLMRKSPFNITLPVSGLVLIAVAGVLLAAGTARRVYRQWTRPMREVTAMVEAVRKGDAPIEELARLGPESTGHLAPLVPMIAELLRELRESQAEVGRLNTEMRQRVAARTDALERRLGSLQAQAQRDPLTGLLNRRVLESFVKEVIDRAAAERQPACVVMMDLDDFKLLNDTLGHAAGDELLRSIGQLIRSSVRQHDLAFRCGGDEFVLLLPDTGRAEADDLVRRLVVLVDGLCKTLPLSRKPGVSAGIASLADCIRGGDHKEWLEVADRHLYAAKHARKSARGAKRTAS